MASLGAKRERRGRSTPGTILYILLGPILWSAHFTVLYSVQSMLCAHGVGEHLVPVIVAAATMVAVLVTGVLILLPNATSRIFGAGGWEGDAAVFHVRAMRGLAALSTAAIVWGGLTSVFIPGCLTLR
jgi:hypothetical protein